MALNSKVWPLQSALTISIWLHLTSLGYLLRFGSQHMNWTGVCEPDFAKWRSKHMFYNGSVHTSKVNWTELTFNKSTQLHDMLTGHSHQYSDLIGCGKARTADAEPVQDMLSNVAVCKLVFSLVQFMCSEQTLRCTYLRCRLAQVVSD